jgi:hypothetical protein
LQAEVFLAQPNRNRALGARVQGSPIYPKGTPDAYRMPQFRQQSSDQDIADVITLIRNGWGNQGPAVAAAPAAVMFIAPHKNVLNGTERCRPNVL